MRRKFKVENYSLIIDRLNYLQGYQNYYNSVINYLKKKKSHFEKCLEKQSNFDDAKRAKYELLASNIEGDNVSKERLIHLSKVNSDKEITLGKKIELFEKKILQYTSRRDSVADKVSAIRDIFNVKETEPLKTAIAFKFNLSEAGYFVELYKNNLQLRNDFHVPVYFNIGGKSDVTLIAKQEITFEELVAICNNVAACYYDKKYVKKQTFGDLSIQFFKKRVCMRIGDIQFNCLIEEYLQKMAPLFNSLYEKMKS